MPYPRFTKVIINHFLSIQKSVPKTLPFGLHKIKDDDVLSRMKFVRIGEDIRCIDLYSSVVFGECRHGKAVLPMMDTAYWSSE
ncbi:hypothetical protein Tco_1004348 [Tanacetum coccineum]|uniref:Uncharacterized protein n=1 Tax=Tanacetum coccineum TaxID=301880 RepID=A0ABQ5FBZ1_9ASTR